MGVSLSAGGAFQWLRDALAPVATADPVSFEKLVALAKDIRPGAEGVLFLPYLLGERSPNLAPEASASWVGLTPMHHLGHLARSVLEGVLLNMREILEVCRQAGLECDRVVASGGATSETLWLQMLADVLGRETVTVTGATEGGAYGAALATGVASAIGAAWTRPCQASAWSARSSRTRRPPAPTTPSSPGTAHCTTDSGRSTPPRRRDGAVVQGGGLRPRRHPGR
ncbi:FGGY-family carbohydrate kinase [Saccharomonospora sp. CUA-673]|uniref:FGGY-family carbohydrate kinase n=1 Tax=Saccharomonospora sp. CUA-673 TaxID=1904969 RepID=UPI002101A8C7|nr:FGGY-family carbohydrate kinase [Saccharomonospora sp. CUA-673]